MESDTPYIFAAIFAIGACALLYALAPVDSQTFYGCQTFKVTDKYYSQENDGYYVDIITENSQCTNRFVYNFGFGIIEKRDYEIEKSAWERVSVNGTVNLDYVCNNGVMKLVSDGWREDAHDFGK